MMELKSQETAVGSLIKFLQFVAEPLYDDSSINFQRFVLQYGCPWVYRPFRGRRMQARQCFMNAFVLHDKNPALTYVEGYACMQGMPPILHAWCIDTEGYVQDPTWKGREATYFGVPFDWRFVEKTSCKRGYFGLIDSPEIGFPLLKPDSNPMTFLAQEWYTRIMGI